MYQTMSTAINEFSKVINGNIYQLFQTWSYIVRGEGQAGGQSLSENRRGESDFASVTDIWQQLFRH